VVAGTGGPPEVKVSVSRTSDPPPITVTRPSGGDGAAGRAQPQHKPRSQRKK
jgi:hypothetical protein